MTNNEKTINAGQVEVIINLGRQSLGPTVLTFGCSAMEKYNFTWWDKSSFCENHKIYTGNKQDCIKQFKSDNPDVPLSRVVVDKITRGWEQ